MRSIVCVMYENDNHLNYSCFRLASMNTTTLLGVSIAAILFAAAVSPSIVSAVGGYSFIDEAEIEANKKKLKELEIETEGDIPTVAGTLLGYGVLTTGEAIVVTASHGGALDSIKQNGASDPVWHQHYLKLQGDDECPAGVDQFPGLSVADLSWTSPGKIEIDDEELELKKVRLGNIQAESALDVGGVPHAFNTGVLTNQVVAFDLAFGPSSQVCVIVTDHTIADDDD